MCVCMCVWYECYIYDHKCMCAHIHKYTGIVYKYTHMLVCNLNLHESDLTQAKYFCSVKLLSDLFNKYITNNN